MPNHRKPAVLVYFNDHEQIAKVKEAAYQARKPGEDASMADYIREAIWQRMDRDSRAQTRQEEGR